MKIRSFISLLFSIAFMFSLVACGSGTQTQDTRNSESELVTEADKEEAEVLSTQSENSTEVLVIFFSATGTTKGVAEKIAAIENADIYEIVPQEPYTDADLNWHDSTSRTTVEQNDPSVRPAIGSEDIDLSGYSKIYVGYPIWWGEEPRIMDSFVESYDFGDATMIPFCTSSSSGIGSSGRNLAEYAGSGNWIDGERFSGRISDDELKNWILSLK